MKHKIIHASAILFLIIFSLHTLQGQTHKIELTKFDITRIKNFSSDRVSAFGVCLGMSKSTAIDVIMANSEIIPLLNKNRPLTIQVYKRTPEKKFEELLMSLEWASETAGLKEIKILDACRPYLIGNTKQLMTSDVINRNSTLYKTFLGKADLTKKNDYTSFINILSTVYYYKSKKIKVEKQVIEGKTSYTFGFYR
ncbi:MAG: hypothetical protein CSA05_03410 [Bacteroidia bacterium]|nr:MAG: hypothetical protein CSB01_00055 [Bacteroidia bacterium]PIE85873.1 MAG: hypothetical protein CSA05_03410 [Bacteroidia bacterium]